MANLGFTVWKFYNEDTNLPFSKHMDSCAQMLYLDWQYISV